MNAIVINCSPVRCGATARIAQIVAECLSARYETKTICIDDYRIEFCRGCRACHATAQCVLRDDVPRLMEEFEAADRIVAVCPSYWADIPGQFKSFIDRCTPWCDTHEPHARLSPGKKGCAIALRTGSNPGECARVQESIRHFFGHLDIAYSGGLSLCRVDCREAVEPRIGEIASFCGQI